MSHGVRKVGGSDYSLIGVHGDSIHAAIARQVICQRIVLCHPVVPHGHRVIAPSKADLVLGLIKMSVDIIEQSITLRFEHPNNMLGK